MVDLDSISSLDLIELYFFLVFLYWITAWFYEYDKFLYSHFFEIGYQFHKFVEFIVGVSVGYNIRIWRFTRYNNVNILWVLNDYIYSM